MEAEEAHPAGGNAHRTDKADSVQLHPPEKHDQYPAEKKIPTEEINEKQNEQDTSGEEKSRHDMPQAPDSSGDTDTVNAAATGPKRNGEKEVLPTSAPDGSERLQVGRQVAHNLEKLSALLKRLCRESDPHFVKIGRDLTIVTNDVKKLTDSIHHAVQLLQNGEQEKISLKNIEDLVQEVFSTLSTEKKAIGEQVGFVDTLITEIFQCDRIREMIDRINSLFRIVRINIRIQCSARGLSDEMFEGVSEDLEELSRTLHQVTKNILRDINQGTKSLGKLQEAIADHLKNIDRVFQEARSIVSKALYDIRQLMNGTQTMIREADNRSRAVSAKVGEVVIGIQFHDSLSQRVDHIIQAFADICSLSGMDTEEHVTDEHLGTCYVILDLQLRQLIQIVREIKLVRERLEGEFQAIEQEVEGMETILHDTQFREIGPQEFMSSLFSSLEKALKQLSALLNQSEKMITQIDLTAEETRTIANNLFSLKEDVTEIREETRVQAVNTIIMASALGHRGRTIEVLAKEIQTLSDQSGVLADDVEAMHLGVSKTVEQLVDGTKTNMKLLDKNKLGEDIRAINRSFADILEVISIITRHIQNTGTHIKASRSSLVFLEALEDTLDTSINTLNKTREMLLPWENHGTLDSEEIQQLVDRYSMNQERMIHMYDRVESTDEMDDDDIFF